MSLIGSNRCDEVTVYQVPEPPWTDTWHPISHGRCIDAVQQILDEREIVVEIKNYSLSSDRLKMFASWVIANGGKEIGASVIFRNSLNKEFPFGLASGNHCFICSNLAFTGEFIQFRRHTKGMNDEELLEIVKRGMDLVMIHSNELIEWQEALHEVKYSEEFSKTLAWDAITDNVISRQRITEFNNLLFGKSDKFPVYNSCELYGFHGAATELIRDMNMNSFISRQIALYEFIEERFGDRLPDVRLTEVA